MKEKFDPNAEYVYTDENDVMIRCMLGNIELPKPKTVRYEKSPLTDVNIAQDLLDRGIIEKKVQAV